MKLTAIEQHMLKAGNPPNPDTTMSKRKLTKDEFLKAQLLLEKGYSVRAIGVALDRCPSSVRLLLKTFGD